MHTIDVSQIHVSSTDGGVLDATDPDSLGLWQHTAIKIVAVYVALGFVVTEILLFAVWCRPFRSVCVPSAARALAE